MWDFSFGIQEELSVVTEQMLMEYWFVLAIVVTFFWGSAGIFAKISTPKIGVAGVALLIASVETVMYSLAFLYWREDVSISLQDGLLAAFSCLIGVTGYLCFFESIIEGQVAIAGTISAAYPALTVVGAIVVLSESLTSVQAVGVLAIIGGVVLLSYEPNPGSKHAMNKRSLFFALMAFLLWGIWSLTSKVAIDRVGPGNIFGFYVLSSITAPVIYAWLRRVRPGGPRMSNPPNSAWALGAIGLVLNVSGTLVYSFSLDSGIASLVVPITSAYPLITIVLAVALLREKLSSLHLIAVGVVVAGLVMIGLTV